MDLTNLFNEYAEKILNNSVLEVKDKRYRICEIEMYYHSSEHLDAYTHKNPAQLEHSTFYPHKYNNKGYKSGTYKCMDLVYGDSEKNIYFGILIRSIQNIETKEFYTGPCISVNEILRNFDCTEFSEFFEKVPSGIEEFKLIDFNLKSEEIFIGPRVGLSDKYPDFKLKNYRYAILIKQIKRQKVFHKLNSSELLEIHKKKSSIDSKTEKKVLKKFKESEISKQLLKLLTKKYKTENTTFYKNKVSDSQTHYYLDFEYESEKTTFCVYQMSAEVISMNTGIEIIWKSDSSVWEYIKLPNEVPNFYSEICSDHSANSKNCKNCKEFLKVIEYLATC